MPQSTWPIRPVLSALFLGTLASTPACTGDEEAQRSDVIAALADHVFVPVHATIQDNADELAAAVAAACDDPTNFQQADHAWRLLHNTWSIRGAFAFGPVEEQTTSLDFWPVREDTIESAIADAPEDLDALGTSAKGMPALEYLLYTGDLMPGTARCDYMLALADDIAERTAVVADAWPAHADALARRAGDLYPTSQAALDAIVNAAIEGLYAMVKTKLDRPLGNLTGSDPDPALVESRYSGNSLTDLDCNLDGFVLVYHGADAEPGGEPGLGVLVAARDADLDVRILAQLDVAREALHAIPDPLADALTGDRSAVQTARDEIDALRRLIKLDVASLLNVTLSLSDNDGD